MISGFYPHSWRFIAAFTTWSPQKNIEHHLGIPPAFVGLITIFLLVVNLTPATRSIQPCTGDPSVVVQSVPFGSKLHLSKMKQPTSWRKKLKKISGRWRAEMLCRWFGEDVSAKSKLLNFTPGNPPPPPSEAQHLSSRLRTKRSMRLKWLLASAWAIASGLQWNGELRGSTGVPAWDQGSAQCIPSHPVGMWGPEDQPEIAPRGIPDRDLMEETTSHSSSIL